jgi:hypothetical protein
MTSRKFPMTRADGTFCVDIGFSIVGGDIGDLAARIQTWLISAWMPNNLSWTRDWRSGPDLSSSKPEVLRYEDTFLSPPSVTVGENAELQLRLIGRQQKSLWKDWLVSKILPDMKDRFPEIGDRLYIRDA